MVNMEANKNNSKYKDGNGSEERRPPQIIILVVQPLHFNSTSTTSMHYYSCAQAIAVENQVMSQQRSTLPIVMQYRVFGMDA